MALHFPHPHPPLPGQMASVAPGVYWLRMPLPFQLNHINLWLLEDGEEWVIVDTGFANDEARANWENILNTLPGKVSRLVSTHFHPDHLGLATWLQEKTGAALYMSSGEFLTAHAVFNDVGGHGARFMSEQFRQHGLSGERLEKFAIRGSGYRKSVPSLPDHYHRLMEGDEMSIGGRIWRVIIGYGHSPEHVGLYCPELDVLISGDMLLPKISTNISVFAATPDANSLRWFLESLKRLAAELPARTLVLPSHGLPFSGVQERVEALREHHDDRLRALEETCQEAPKSAAELLATLFGRALDTHQTMFAMGEAIAHLNYLEQAGRLSRQTDDSGVIRFFRA